MRYATKLAVAPAVTRVAPVFSPNVHAHPQQQVILRPYQEECVQSCLDAFKKDGVNRIGVSSPTGSGKTTIFCNLISRMEASQDRPEANQALVLVGSIELARQAAAQLQRMFPHLYVEIEQGQKHNATGHADVTVATYQTLKEPNRLSKFDPKYFKVVIVDEAHHATAPSYLKILSHFNSSISSSAEDTEASSSYAPAVPIVGFSATFHRHDGYALGKVFQEIVYHQHFLDMIKDQWLCPVTFTTVKASIDLSEVKINNRTGDFTPSSLAQVVNTDSVNKLVVRTWLDRAVTRKATLVFCVNIAHVKDLSAAFREAGVDARYITGLTPAAERKMLVDAFKAGEYPVLVNCAILTEGADIPNIDCVMIARPTRSKNVFAQIIGRGMRLSPATGKADCRIVDFVDSLNRVGDIVSGPTLFGLEPDEVIEDDSLDRSNVAEEPQPTLRKAPETVPDPTSVTYIEAANPFVPKPDGTGSWRLQTLSRNAWVHCGRDVWVLECLKKGFLKIVRVTESEEGEEEAYFEATFTPSAGDTQWTGSPFLRKRKVLTAPTLEHAIRGCDTYASTKVLPGVLASSLLRAAPWRQAPATEKQKEMLRKRLQSISYLLKNPEPTSIDTLTKGDAMNVIVRLRHGAQGEYKKRVKVAAKAQAAAERDQKRRDGHQVRVGPLSS